MYYYYILFAINKFIINYNVIVYINLLLLKNLLFPKI